jgi:hypothetical protein
MSNINEIIANGNGQSIVNEAITSVIPKSWNRLPVVLKPMSFIINELASVGSSRVGALTVTFTSGSKSKKGVKALGSAKYGTYEVGTSYSNKVQKKSQTADFQPYPSWAVPYTKNGAVVRNGNKINELRYIRVIGDKSYKFDSQYFTVLEGFNLISTEEAYTAKYMTPSGLKKPTTKGRGLVPENEDFSFNYIKLQNVKYIKIEGTLYENADFQGLM